MLLKCGAGKLAGRSPNFTAVRSFIETPWRGPQFAAGREWIGPGHNGDLTYADRMDHWWPALRFQRETPEIKKLREKEKGDWKSLSIDDKKKLYRFNFCQTLAEVEAHEYLYWKAGWIPFFIVGVVTILGEWYNERFLEDDCCRTFSNEWAEAFMERQLVLMSEPVTGWSSNWDYENGKWRKSWGGFNFD